MKMIHILISAQYNCTVEKDDLYIEILKTQKKTGYFLCSLTSFKECSRCIIFLRVNSVDIVSRLSTFPRVEYISQYTPVIKTKTGILEPGAESRVDLLLLNNP